MMGTHCLFATDLHGDTEKYEKLFEAVERSRPAGVFLGGDLLPHFSLPSKQFPSDRFIERFLVPRLESLRRALGHRYPDIFLILGNDDLRIEEAAIIDLETRRLWNYAHDRLLPFHRWRVLGYSYIPPSPLLLKDWEKYDVSRFVDPGCVSPEEGRRSIPVPAHEIRYATIQRDLERLSVSTHMNDAILLSHSPPHRTRLDRAQLDDRKVDHVPLDVHVGSIAIRRFIESRQPLLTLHGHVHESARMTGSWRDRLGHTHMFNAAHDGPELALIRFDLEAIDSAERVLL